MAPKYIIRPCQDCDIEFGTYDNKRIYCDRCQVIHKHFGSDDDIGVVTNGYVTKDIAAKALGLNKSAIYYYESRGMLRTNKRGEVEENSIKELQQYRALPNNISAFDRAIARHDTGELKGYTIKQAAKELGYVGATVKAKCIKDEILLNKDGTVNKKSLDNYKKLLEQKQIKLYICGQCNEEFEIDKFFIHKGVCKKCGLSHKKAERVKEKEVVAKELSEKRTETVVLHLTPEAKKQLEDSVRNLHSLKDIGLAEVIFFNLRYKLGWGWNK